MENVKIAKKKKRNNVKKSKLHVKIILGKRQTKGYPVKWIKDCLTNSLRLPEAFSDYDFCKNIDKRLTSELPIQSNNSAKTYRGNKQNSQEKFN